MRTSIGGCLAIFWVAGVSMPALLRAQTPVALAARVLVLVNDRMPAEAGTGKTGASLFVGRYYAKARGIPDANILRLSTSTEEWISYDDYLAQIEAPVRKFLDARNGAMRHQILYIVPVYGIPLKTHTPNQTVAVDSMLSAMYSTPSGTLRLASPYYTKPGSRPPRFDVWSDQREAAGEWKMFLVSRLDGPGAAMAQGLVDKAVAAEPTLTKRSGTAYFDYQGTRQPSEPLYPFDRDMWSAAALSRSRGFSTTLHVQKDAACHLQIHPGAAYYYDPAAKNVAVSSFGGDASMSRSFPPFTEGEATIALRGVVRGTGNFLYVTLATSDPETYIRLAYPFAPFAEYKAGEQITLEKVVAGHSLKAVAAVDKSAEDTLKGLGEIRVQVENEEIRVLRNGTLLISLADLKAAPLNLAQVSIGSHCADFVVSGIQVSTQAGAVFSDTFTRNTAAEYEWTLAPLEGHDALWAWGWYGPAYDAYRFVPGAVGAQLTSYTASTLRKPVNPDPALRGFADKRWGGNWVPRMLEEGVTATWGAVEEPYAQFYTSGTIFFDHFWSGYNFGESFAIAQNVLRWTMVAVGDPLYAPAAFQEPALSARGR